MRAIYQLQHAQREAARQQELAREIGEFRAQLVSGQGDSATATALAKALLRANRHESAIEVLATWRSANPTAEAHLAYAKLLVKCDAFEAALEELEGAIAGFPHSVLLRLKHALLLPVVYQSPAQVARCRSRFAEGLERLHFELDLSTRAKREEAWAAVRGHHNFYLPYQGGNDRDLQQRYAGYVSRIIEANFPYLTATRPRNRKAGPRRRVGYLSAHFRDHSVTKTHLGWVEGLNREHFEVFAYQVGDAADHVTRQVQRTADHFIELSGEVTAMVERVRADDLDVAIFLDVGMGGAATGLLSAFRLAPHQCATWGHPVTTGSPAVDYFLSSELMEPPTGQDHYSEQLVRLPGIGIPYRKPVIPRPLLEPSRAKFGIDEDSVVYLCCQSSFKYLPAHDDVMAQIALRVPRAQFVFLSSNTRFAGALRRRLVAAFDKVGLDVGARCVFLPSLPSFDYWELNLCADVFLDSLEWSGCNTTIEGIACGLPVVTLPGGLMRGRHAYAFLKGLAAGETIAADKAHYVDIAVRLAEDVSWRKAVGTRMMEGLGSLCDDPSSIAALEEFLQGLPVSGGR